MKKYKAKLKRDFAISLERIVEEAIESFYPTDDDDKLFIAALAEIKMKLTSKLIEVKPKYSIQFSTVQAFALRMLHTESFGFNAYTDYTANRLLQISNEIHQHYS